MKTVSNILFLSLIGCFSFAAGKNLKLQDCTVSTSKVANQASKEIQPIPFVERFQNRLYKKSGNPAMIQAVSGLDIKYSTWTGISGFYDYQSNGRSPRYLYIDPSSNYQTFHACMMTASDSTDTAHVSATRRVGYAISNDGGQTWKSSNDVTNGTRMGFPCVVEAPMNLNDGFGNPLPLVVGHTGNGSTFQTSLYVGDSANAVTGFTGFNAPQTSAGGLSPVIWPTAVPTADGNVFLTGTVSPAVPGTPQAPIQTSTFNTSTTVFGKYQNLGDSLLTFNSGGEEVTAVSKTGTIGVAWPHYFTSDANYGIYFAESTDNGKTFGTPTQIFGLETTPSGQIDPINHPAPDSLFLSGNMDLVYAGETPHIVFTAAWDGYFKAEEVWHWSPSSGAKRIAKTDTNNYLGSSRMIPQPNMGAFAFPTIGVGDEGQRIFCVFQATSQWHDSTKDSDYVLIDPTTNFSFYQLWGVASPDGGQTWSRPLFINGILAILQGETYNTASFEYPHLAPLNHTIDTTTVFNLVFMTRQHPGMFAFTAGGTSGPINRTYLYYQPVGLTPQDFVPVNAVAEQNSTYPAAEIVAQNYPNPFASSTSISFTLPEMEHVTLKVYDMLGRIVATLANGTMYAGGHNVSFDASGMPGGMYVYQLATPHGIVSHTMALNK